MDGGHPIEEQQLKIEEQQLKTSETGSGGFEVVDDPRGGFVLALVVLLLFGIGVAGAASYQVVFSEALLSVHAKETHASLSIARAGLRLYVGQQIGVHDDTVAYSIEGGDAVVTARLVSKISDYETLYLLGSEGVYTDPTFTGSAARRTVYQYAIKRETVLDHLAALTQVSGPVRLHNGTRTYGVDQAAAEDCEQSETDIIGVVMGSGALQIDGSANVNGTSNTLLLGTESAVLDSLGLDWDFITDPSFPVDYEGVLPPCGLAADSFPVTRFNGDLSVTSSSCGRGVLIVKNTLTAAVGWSWDGVILAGFFNPPNGYIEVNGLVVSGLDGLGGYTDLRRGGSSNGAYVRYNRCYAFQANRRLSHFEPVGGTWWEAM